MSGAEAAFVLGLIFGVISICKATKAIYEAAKDTKGQPEAFRQVRVQLTLVIAILDRTKERAKKVDEKSQKALGPILKSCKAKAENHEGSGNNYANKQSVTNSRARRPCPTLRNQRRSGSR